MSYARTCGASTRSLCRRHVTRRRRTVQRDAHKRRVRPRVQRILPRASNRTRRGGGPQRRGRVACVYWCWQTRFLRQWPLSFLVAPSRTRSGAWRHTHMCVACARSVCSACVGARGRSSAGTGTGRRRGGAGVPARAAALGSRASLALAQSRLLDCGLFPLLLALGAAPVAPAPEGDGRAPHRPRKNLMQGSA